MTQPLPDVLTKPCSDCPWRRIAAPGWLGPLTAEEWWATAHSDMAIACHLTITNEDWDDPGMRQCAGVAIYRSNVHKSPRDPEVLTLPENLDTVFGLGEFVKYHTGKD